jgi:hypothetical protein
MAFTNHTNNADIWHGQFTFLNGFGQRVLTTPELDGVPMRQIGQIYEWRVPSANLALTTFNYSSITQVMWKGSC